jgi:hypothetical protein
MVLTSVVIDEWATVAEVSTATPGTLTAAGIGVFSAVGVAVPNSVGGPMVILMM